MSLLCHVEGNLQEINVKEKALERRLEFKLFKRSEGYIAIHYHVF